MLWIVAVAAAVILLFIFLNSPARLAIALTRTAMHARNRKDWTRAAKFYREALATAARLKDPLKSRIEGQIQIQFASLLYRQGRMRDAEDLFRQGYSKVEVPANYREYQVAQQGFLYWGDLYTDEGRHYEAELQYRKALEGDERTGNLGMTIFDLQRLSDSLILQERRQDAEEVINKTIALETRVIHESLIRQGKNPAEHPVISMNMPDLHFCREQYEDARRLYREKVEYWERQVTRPDNIDVGRLQMRLALAEAQTGHRAEALEMYTRAESTFQREWCEEHPKAAAAREMKTTLMQDAVEARG